MIAPSWIELARLWMMTHFKGKDALVIFNPLGILGVENPPEDMLSMLRSLYSERELGELIHCEFAIKVMPSIEAMAWCNKFDKRDTYISVWSGSMFVHENT